MSGPEKTEPPANAKGGPERLTKPSWIRVRLPSGDACENVKRLVRAKSLHTVCEEALCPNLAECWGRGTATFLIMGAVCTRNCSFCGVKSGVPDKIDEDEPLKIAEAIAAMGLRYAVITSVTRDDLFDGGASCFVRAIHAIREKVAGCRVEVLVPDFRGNRDAVVAVARARPEVFAHNIETVARLYPAVRPEAQYARSLAVLGTAREIEPDLTIKSGMMVGLGESEDEILRAMADLREAGCEMLTIGQYLSPTRSHFPVLRYYTPDEFERLKQAGLEAGFKRVESAPLVRSSYRAEDG